jgi:hypothetical protein
LLDNAALRARMGATAQARVRAEFSMARMVEQTTALYRQVAEPR